MASIGFHESEERLRPATRDLHRAIVSLMEELEAIDWYQQRVDATEDAELRAILQHNRDEEAEHAVMVLEWLRRHDAVLDRKLRAYLFSEGSIVVREDALEHGGAAAANGTAAPTASLGSLRGGR
jgi:ferritin-like protein